MNLINNSRVNRLFLLIVFLLFTLTFYRTAWIAEDAFITFRVVANTIDGEGLVWNIGERVQAFTHPLWFFIITPLVFVFKDPYFVSVGLSYFLLILSLYLCFCIFDKKIYPFVIVIFLLFSKSFVDYSSSGLENPLIHFLLILFFLCWINDKKAIYYLLIFSLVFLTRPDAILLLSPAVLLVMLKKKSIKLIFLGFMPAVIWVLFSLFYYGAPIPNTALAKVGTSLALSDKFVQAFYYFQWVFDNDLPTLIIIFFGIVSGFLNKKYFSFSVGLIIFIFYLFYVGADYMGGRFLSAPVLISIVLIGLAGQKICVGIFILCMAFLSPYIKNTIFSPLNFNNLAIKNGIADERGFYYGYLGLSPVIRNGSWMLHPWFHEGSLKPGIYTRCTIGMTGFSGGKKIYWIDPLALIDPFLARLPSRSNARVGHYERAFPEGYLDSIVSDENRIVDSGMKNLFSDVKSTVSGPLFSQSRLKAVWRLNTGFHRDATKLFNKELIGLPGIKFITNSPLSCYGIPYGGDKTWRINGVPAKAFAVEKIDFLNN